MKKQWYCKVDVNQYDHEGVFVSEFREILPGTYVGVYMKDLGKKAIGKVTMCRYGELGLDDLIGSVTKIVSKKENDDYIKITHKYSNDQVYDLIEKGEWEEVLEWAFDYSMSGDEEISKNVIHCYHLCIEHGLPRAAFYLAYSYYHGVDIEQDKTEAIKWTEYASDKDIAEAFALCSDYYANSKDKDISKAYHYALLGALSHDRPVCYLRLGYLTERDASFDKSTSETIGYYEKALELITDDIDMNIKPAIHIHLAQLYLNEKSESYSCDKAYMHFAGALISMYSCGELNFKEFIDFTKERIDAVEKLI